MGEVVLVYASRLRAVKRKANLKKFEKDLKKVLDKWKKMC